MVGYSAVGLGSDLVDLMGVMLADAKVYLLAVMKVLEQVDVKADTMANEMVASKDCLLAG